MAGKKKKKAVIDLTSEDTLDYIYLSDAMYPRLSGQGCYQNTQQTISYETWKRSRGSFFGDDNLTNKKTSIVVVWSFYRTNLTHKNVVIAKNPNYVVWRCLI